MSTDQNIHAATASAKMRISKIHENLNFLKQQPGDVENVKFSEKQIRHHVRKLEAALTELIELTESLTEANSIL